MRWSRRFPFTKRSPESLLCAAYAANVPPMRPGGAEVAELEGPAIVLSLPGGCHLTQEQYDSYQKFQITPNIQKW